MIVEKTREKYLFKEFEIVIDNIKKNKLYSMWGVFVEIELRNQVDDVNSGVESIHGLLRTIGIKSFEKQIAGSGKMKQVSL